MKPIAFSALLALVITLIVTLYAGCGQGTSPPPALFPSSFQYVVPAGVQQ